MFICYHFWPLYRQKCCYKTLFWRKMAIVFVKCKMDGEILTKPPLFSGKCPQNQKWRCIACSKVQMGAEYRGNTPSTTATSCMFGYGNPTTFYFSTC